MPGVAALCLDEFAVVELDVARRCHELHANVIGGSSGGRKLLLLLLLLEPKWLRT